MALLPKSRILGLHRAALLVGLDRTALLAGISTPFSRSIPLMANPSEQILVDLHHANDVGSLTDNSVPLITWLETAVRLTELRRESSVFEVALAETHQALSATPVDPARAPSKADTVVRTGEPAREPVSADFASRVSGISGHGVSRPTDAGSRASIGWVGGRALSIQSFLQGSSGRDWIFLGFFAFALGMSALTGFRRVRLSSAIDDAAICIAQQNPTCAAKHLGDARAINAEDPRVDIVAAGMDILLGDLDEARRKLATFKSDGGGRPLDAKAKGELLLIQGDLDYAKGAGARAEERYAAAKALVADANLVEIRLNRLHARAKDKREELIRGFYMIDELIETAANGDIGTVLQREPDITSRIAKVEDQVLQGKLRHALEAVDRVASLPSGDEPTMPTLPVKPIQEDKPALRVPRDRNEARYPNSMDVYNSQLAAYNQALAAYKLKLAAYDQRVVLNKRYLHEARAWMAEARTRVSGLGSPAP